jgi:hypothetical protein
VLGGQAEWMGLKELFKGKYHTDEIASAAVNKRAHIRFVVSYLRHVAEFDVGLVK